MVRHVQQRAVELCRAAGQRVDHARQHMVGVEQCVVVGIRDLRQRAARQVIELAGRREALERRRIAAEVRRPVIAQHVQHQYLRSLGLVQVGVEAGQQRLVQAVAAAAQRRRGAVARRARRQPFAHALATRLVVQPKHAGAGTRQHMQQRLAAADARLVVVAPADRREHAGHRDLGIGAAGRYVAEVDDVALGELRRGLACVAAQPPVGGARRLADHQHQKPRTRGLRP